MGVALSTILLISSSETSSNRDMFFTDDAAKKFFPTSKISAQEIWDQIKMTFTMTQHVDHSQNFEKAHVESWLRILGIFISSEHENAWLHF